MPEGFEPLREGQHPGDVLGGPRIGVRRQEVEHRGVGVERRLVGVGDVAGGSSLEPGRDEHRIHLASRGVFPEMPDVGDVLDVQHLEPVVQEGSPDEVSEQECPEIPDVRVAVDGRSAGVHPNPARFERLHRHHLATEGVAAAEGQRLTLRPGIHRPEPNDRRPFAFLPNGAPPPRIVPPAMRRGAFPYSPAMRRRGALVALVALAIGLLVRGTTPFPTRAADPDEVRILAGEPATFDPAGQGDTTTAAVTAQLHETLTTYDSALQLQPALAASWDVADDGRQVVFHLRPDLTFSDGTPLAAEDVVGSWLRLIDPSDPSP